MIYASWYPLTESLGDAVYGDLLGQADPFQAASNYNIQRRSGRVRAARTKLEISLVSPGEPLRQDHESHRSQRDGRQDGRAREEGPQGSRPGQDHQGELLKGAEYCDRSSSRTRFCYC